MRVQGLGSYGDYQVAYGVSKYYIEFIQGKGLEVPSPDFWEDLERRYAVKVPRNHPIIIKGTTILGALLSGSSKKSGFSVSKL